MGEDIFSLLTFFFLSTSRFASGLDWDCYKALRRARLSCQPELRSPVSDALRLRLQTHHDDESSARSAVTVRHDAR